MPDETLEVWACALCAETSDTTPGTLVDHRDVTTIETAPLYGPMMTNVRWIPS